LSTFVSYVKECCALCSGEQFHALPERGGARFAMLRDDGAVRGEAIDRVIARDPYGFKVGSGDVIRSLSQWVQDALKVHRHSDGSECISLLTTELRDRVTEVQQSPK